jgi:hypothetical protein
MPNQTTEVKMQGLSPILAVADLRESASIRA